MNDWTLGSTATLQFPLPRVRSGRTLPNDRQRLTASTWYTWKTHGDTFCHRKASQDSDVSAVDGQQRFRAGAESKPSWSRLHRRCASPQKKTGRASQASKATERVNGVCPADTPPLPSRLTGTSSGVLLFPRSLLCRLDLGSSRNVLLFFSLSSELIVSS